jgi:hypothetical protein
VRHAAQALFARTTRSVARLVPTTEKAGRT